MKVRFLALLLLLPAGRLAAAEALPWLHLSLGSSWVALNGPWKFHLGDNPDWAQPGFDDEAWETVDLTPALGAHDGDVGLTGFVSGWGARGHHGSSGFAWYRLRLMVANANNAPLALAGPPALDSAYQLFADGRLLGGCGNFSRSPPVAFSVQPRLFYFEAPVFSASPQAMVIALRVWMGPWSLGDPAAGGIRISPTLGAASSVALLYERQWRQTILGYVIEVVEAMAFLILASLAVTLRSNNVAWSAWLAAALILTALYRANQAIFFWFQIESVQMFEFISVVVLSPLALAAWTGAWAALSGKSRRNDIVALAALTLAYVLVQFLSRSWFHGDFPTGVTAAIHWGAKGLRWSFLVLSAYFAWRVLRQSPRPGWLVVVLLLASMGQFASELSDLGLKGIWFPFGVGVSRTQFAYAALDLVLLAYFFRLVRSFARSHCRKISA